MIDLYEFKNLVCENEIDYHLSARKYIYINKCIVSLKRKNLLLKHKTVVDFFESF